MALEKKEQPVFGTSGLRGLATALTDPLCGRHVQAFLMLQEPAPAGLLIGRDLRASSPRIAAAAARAALSCGVRVWDCGALPTPALALAAAESGLPAVMVTGSHIPAERNGLKFLTAAGDIGKAEEVRIADLAAVLPDPADASGATWPGRDVMAAYRDRLIRFFGAGALKGCRIGIFQHSSVARDLLVDLVVALGAEAYPFGRTDQFLPLDTEAVEDALRRDLARRAADGGYDAILSADPDADRPFMVDDEGRLVAGDSLALLAARALGAEAVVTPYTSNRNAEGCGWFAQVRRTDVGAPHVIAALQAAAAGRKCAGYEANGGLILGFAALRGGQSLAPLFSRDACLPMIAVLAEVVARRMPVSALLAELPDIATATGRLQNIPSSRSEAAIAALRDDPARRGQLFEGFGAELEDGDADALPENVLCCRFEKDRQVILRPSGNAPELRAYVEAPSAARPEALLAALLERLVVQLS